MAKLTGFDAPDAIIKFNGEVSDGQPKRLLSTYRANSILGWTASTTLEDGIKRTIKWYRANKQQIIAADAS
jgi:nucleoside-diphosphate-sugar epimerase